MPRRNDPKLGTRALIAAMVITFVEVGNYVLNPHFAANGPVVLGALSVPVLFGLAFYGLGIDHTTEPLRPMRPRATRDAAGGTSFTNLPSETSFRSVTEARGYDKKYTSDQLKELNTLSSLRR